MAKRKLPRYLSQDEAERLLAAPNLRYPTGLRNRCLLELMYRAGLRVGEVVALRPRDVNVASGTIRAVGKTGDRTAYFDPERVGPLLEDWKRVRRRLPRSKTFFCTLHGGPVSTRYVQQMVRRMATRAKIETRVTPHMLRHTFATQLREEGFDLREVQEALGHRDIRSTEIYTHVMDANLRAKIAARSRTSRSRR